MTIKTRRWTPELRAKQAKIIRQRKPWQKSSGPKTEAGKAAISKNALKHGFRSAEHRAFCALLRDLDARAQAVMDDIAHDDKDRS